MKRGLPLAGLTWPLRGRGGLHPWGTAPLLWQRLGRTAPLLPRSAACLCEGRVCQTQWPSCVQVWGCGQGKGPTHRAPGPHALPINPGGRGLFLRIAEPTCMCPLHPFLGELEHVGAE